MLLLALLVLTAPASARNINLCDVNCTLPPLLDLQSGEVVVLTGCSTDTLNLTFARTETEANNFPLFQSLRVTDLHLEEEDISHVIYYTNSLPPFSQNVFSVSNRVELSLSWAGGTTPPLGVIVSCLENVVLTDDIGMEQPTGNESFTLIPNTRREYTFRSENLHAFNLSFDKGDSIAGFGLVELDDGTWGLVSGHADLVLHNPSDVTKLQLFTVGPEVKAELSWDLGQMVFTPPSTTTTTTASPPNKDEQIMVYVLAINEMTFVTDHLKELNNRVAEIINSTCENMTMTEYLGPPVSCRQSCFMTNNPDRGCVKVAIDFTHFSTLYSCQNFTKDQLIRYLRTELEKILPDLAKDFQASEVMLDSCTTISITSSWVVGALAITAATLVLAIAVLCLARWATRSKRRWREERFGESPGTGYTSMKASHWEVSK